MEMELRGGLGDIFIMLHEYNVYDSIEAMEANDHAKIWINSHNPYCHEIFKWHPYAERIEVYSAPKFFFNYFDANTRRKAGFPDKGPAFALTRRERKPITVYPSPEDVEVIGKYLPKTPYLAMSVTASDREKSIPDNICKECLCVCRNMGIPVIALGRSYDMMGNGRVELIPQAKECINLINRLSVPGTMEVIKRSAAVLTCHSCLLLLSWYERKPNFCVYPPRYADLDFVNPSPFGFGKDYPETRHMSYMEYSKDKYTVFLNDVFGPLGIIRKGTTQ